MKEVNRKVLVIVLALAVAMLALPMSSVLATKPAALTGTILMLPGGMPSPYSSMRPCGKSDIGILTWDGLPMVISGDIEGSGVYDGTWITCMDPFGLKAANGWYILDVTIGELSGQLTIRVLGLKMTIISGTGDLTNLHGTGSIEMISPVLYSYSMDVHFDP